MLGTPQESDALVWSDAEHPTWMCGAEVTDDGRCVVEAASARGAACMPLCWTGESGATPLTDAPNVPPPPSQSYTLRWFSKQLQQVLPCNSSSCLPATALTTWIWPKLPHTHSLNAHTPNHPTTPPNRYVLLYVSEGCLPANRLFYLDLAKVPPHPETGALDFSSADLTSGECRFWPCA